MVKKNQYLEDQIITSVRVASARCLSVSVIRLYIYLTFFS